MSVLVIIPAYQEHASIGTVVRSVLNKGYDVLVIDDGSSDATALCAKKAGAYVVCHQINRGYGAALSTGNMWAQKHRYDAVVHFDADGQHDPDEIAAVVAPIERGEADAVLGSRFLKKNDSIPRIRRIFIKGAIWFTFVVSGVKLTDAHNGFRAISLDALKKISCTQRGMSYASEIIDQFADHHIRIAEIPVTISYTEYSRSKGEGNIKKIMTGARFLWEKMIGQ